MACWPASATICPMICSNSEAWPSTETSAAEGWLPTTAPILVSTTSERRCSALERPPVVARKRAGSAIRQVTRLWMTRFFLSSLRNSAVTGLKVSRRLSSRTTVSKGKGRLTKSPGSFTTRATWPKRRKRPYSVTSMTTKQDQMVSAARRPPTSARVRAGARPEDLLRGREDLFQRLDVQAEARQVGRAVVLLLAEGEGQRVPLREKE